MEALLLLLSSNLVTNAMHYSNMMATLDDVCAGVAFRFRSTPYALRGGEVARAKMSMLSFFVELADHEQQ